MSERQHWGQYQQAYEQAMRHTSKAWAPWYAIPADDKPRMRLEVAKIVLAHLEDLPLQWPRLDSESEKQLRDYREGLASGKL